MSCYLLKQFLAFAWLHLRQNIALWLVVPFPRFFNFEDKICACRGKNIITRVEEGDEVVIHLTSFWRIEKEYYSKQQLNKSKQNKDRYQTSDALQITLIPLYPTRILTKCQKILAKFLISLDPWLIPKLSKCFVEMGFQAKILQA